MNKTTVFILSVLGWLTPLYPFFIMTGVSIGLDTYFGVRLARKNNELDSRKFSRVLYKLFIYNLIVISGYLLDIYLLGSFVELFSPIELTVTKAIVFGILVSELFSIDETLLKLDGKGIRFHIKRILRISKKINRERKEFD